MSRGHVPVSPAQVDTFYSEAEMRYARIMAGGKTIPWPEMRAYLEARIAGIPARAPKSEGATSLGIGSRRCCEKLI